MTDAQDAEHKALALRDLRAALDTVYTDVWRVIDALGDAITSEQRRDLRVSAEIPDMKVDVRYSPTGDKGATFSPCSGYRYALAYSMPVPGERTCAFVMLNPSTADELEPDPTVRRCMGFANRIGRHLLVANLFALRSTDPLGLLAAVDPVGPLNDQHITKLPVDALIICAWGEPSNSRLKRLVRERVAQVVELLKGRELYALAVTKSGAPRHPLYLRADSELKEWPVRP